MLHGHFLRLSVVFVAALPFAAQLAAQQQQDASRPIYSGTPELNTTSNLPIQKVGPEDLLGLGVYDAPEFTRTVRISADGTIRLRC